jgi:long-chain fatty acid transport protein
MRKKLSFNFLVVIMSASLAYGSGFSIYEQGAKASALGGAFIAQANDLSAIFYNPAGITQLKGLNVGLGATIILPQFSFTGPTSYDPNYYNEAEKEVFPPPHFYITNPCRLNNDITFGFGFYVPFGLGSKWDEDWAGKQLATETSLQTYYLNPVVAYRFSDMLSVAAGFTYAMGTVILKKAVYFTPREVFGNSALEADGSGMGFTLGLQLKPMKNLTVGATYKSNVTLEFEGGDATFDFPATGNAAADAEIAAYFPDTKGSADLKLPEVIGIGIAYHFSERLTAEFNYLAINWSSYDKIVIAFDDPVAGNKESTAERNFEDSYSLRFGFDYKMSDKLSLRLGYIADQHAVPDNYVEPSLPGGDRHLYSIGAGYKMGALDIDAFYMLLTQDEREITNSVHDFNGTYKGLGNLFGINFSYAFNSCAGGAK